jgi:hypothetical protein
VTSRMKGSLMLSWYTGYVNMIKEKSQRGNLMDEVRSTLEYDGRK